LKTPTRNPRFTVDRKRRSGKEDRMEIGS
jgi:hypothetical protein